MPLLEMIGVDSCRKSFCIAFPFLSETEDDYSWALQHLQSLYQQELPSVVPSPDEKTFNLRLADFERKRNVIESVEGRIHWTFKIPYCDD
jgi:hypothetical protein